MSENFLGTDRKVFYARQTAEKMSTGGNNPFVVSRAWALRAGPAKKPGV